MQPEVITFTPETLAEYTNKMLDAFLERAWLMRLKADDPIERDHIVGKNKAEGKMFVRHEFDEAIKLGLLQAYKKDNRKDTFAKVYVLTKDLKAFLKHHYPARYHKYFKIKF